MLIAHRSGQCYLEDRGPSMQGQSDQWGQRLQWRRLVRRVLLHRLSLPGRPLLLPRRGLLGRLVLLRQWVLWRLRVRLLQ